MNVGDKSLLSRRIRKKQLRSLEKTIKVKKHERQTNEKQILDRILWNEPAGRSTAELVAYTGLHRDTINEICGNLINRGLIGKSNKKGKYHLTEKAYGNNRVRSQLFKQNVMANLLKWEIPTDKENAFCKIKEKNVKTNDQDLLLLFRFSNRIVAFIIYTFIEALRPGMWNKTINIAEENHKNDKISVSGGVKDRITLEWVQQIIEPKNLLWLFSTKFLPKKRYTGSWVEPPPKWVMRSPRYYELSNDDRRRMDEQIENDLHNWRNEYLSDSTWELDKNSHDKLLSTFKKLYPHLYNELELIRNNLDDQIKLLIEHQPKVPASRSREIKKSKS